jgi:hypothetical protein
MAERRNTLVCTFDPASPRITAYDIHEWIYETLRLPESDVLMIQIDGIRRQVYTKMSTKEKVQAALLVTGGQTQYKYPTGQIATVNLDSGTRDQKYTNGKLTAGNYPGRSTILSGTTRENNKHRDREMVQTL